MRIAILGATSMLAADFVATALEQSANCSFTLFARNPEHARKALASRGVRNVPACLLLDKFEDCVWDAIINFIGVGDPARAVTMGAGILQITRDWDDRILSYLNYHDNCRYIFFSSGAVFGQNATDVATQTSSSSFPVNSLQFSNYYGISKFYAEAVHRSHVTKNIIDIRIFNYVSEYADLNHKFLINQVLNAIRESIVLSVNGVEIWRDYIGRHDVTRLIFSCLTAPVGTNCAVDAYTVSPISNFSLLDLYRDNFGLQFEISGGGVDATGAKSNYYSKNRVAEMFGFKPAWSSADTLMHVGNALFCDNGAV